MEFGVLGPLRAVDDEGRDLTPTATKPRQMLAVLLLAHGHIAPVEVFIKELWDGNPTPTALACVHTYTMRLRQAFCEPSPDERTTNAEGQRLVTLEHAYRLDVRPGELDLDTFHDRVNAGRTRLAQKDYEAAARLLREALDLWQRGPVLPDVLAGPVLYPTIRGLEVTRLEVLGQRIWAELNLGQHHELVSELSALQCRHPTNEVFATQLMLALHRSGRRADALEVFHRHRAALREEELGLTPPAQLHELYTDILRDHDRLERMPSAPVLDMAS
jgi:SARP family transcriptional regulator, regulator of embCAB operon